MASAKAWRERKGSCLWDDGPVDAASIGASVLVSTLDGNEDGQEGLGLEALSGDDLIRNTTRALGHLLGLRALKCWVP